LLELVIIEVVFLALGILSAKVRTVLGETTLIWRSLGSPPGKAVRVVDGDYTAVRVQTEQGQTYFCRWYSPEECWIHKDQASYSPNSTVVTSDSSVEFSFYRFRKPPLLQGVVDTKKFFDMPSEYEWVLSIYAVKGDGKVYVWQDSHDSFGLGPLIYGCQGILVAPLCGFVLWWFIQRREAGSPRREHAAQKTT